MALRHGATFLLKQNKTKTPHKPTTVFLRHPFRCSEADVSFVFNEIKNDDNNNGVSFEAVIIPSLSDHPSVIWVTD